MFDKSTYKHLDGDEAIDAAAILASRDAGDVAILLGEDVSIGGRAVKNDVTKARDAIVGRDWSSDYVDFVIDMYRARSF